MTPRKYNNGASVKVRGSSPSIAAVTFDVTHTLIHSPCMAEIYSTVLRRHGVIASSREIERKISWVWKEFSCLADPRQDRFAMDVHGARGWWYRFLLRLCQHMETSEPSRFAAAELFDRFSRPEAWEIYSDVIPTLEALQEAGLRLAVISNWDHRLPNLLKRLRLSQYFDTVVYSSAVGIEKPNPQIFRTCLAAIEVRPTHAVHIGDSLIEDVEGAMAAGMRAVRVDRSVPRCHLLDLLEPIIRREGLRRNPRSPSSTGGNHGRV